MNVKDISNKMRVSEEAVRRAVSVAQKLASEKPAQVQQEIGRSAQQFAAAVNAGGQHLDQQRLNAQQRMGNIINDTGAKIDQGRREVQQKATDNINNVGQKVDQARRDRQKKWGVPW